MRKLTADKFNFNLIYLILLLVQIDSTKSQSGGSGGNPQGQQTVVGSTTSTGTQVSNSYAPNLIGTHVPIAANDPAGPTTPTAQDSFVADTASATYADAIAGSSTTPPTDDSSKSSTSTASTKTADLAKVAVQDVTNWLCAATSIVGDIPGCNKADSATAPTSSTTPATSSTTSPATPSTSSKPNSTTANPPGSTTTPGAPIMPKS